MVCEKYGEYDESNPECSKCDGDVREKCKQLRIATREFMIQKLDAGSRQLLIGHLWTIGDALASNPINDAVRIIMLCEAYMNSFGVTDLGKTGFMDPELYDKVQELHNDLTEYLHVMVEIYPKCKSDAEFDALVVPPLSDLEDKYSKKGKRIYGDPAKVLRAIKDIFYKQNMYPKIISQITTVTATSANVYNVGGFNPQNVPRFRNPAIDGQKGR